MLKKIIYALQRNSICKGTSLIILNEKIKQSTIIDNAITTLGITETNYNIDSSIRILQSVFMNKVKRTYNAKKVNKN